jgi:hypothetical protein
VDGKAIFTAPAIETISTRITGPIEKNADYVRLIAAGW